MPTSYEPAQMSSSTEPVLYLGVVSDDIRSAMMYGPSPIEAMIVAVRLRDAIERYNREWWERSALQNVRQDQDDQSCDSDDHARTANDTSDLHACVGDCGARTVELDRL